MIQRFHYPLEVMMTCVRWYAAYPLSFRHLEEMMGERGGFCRYNSQLTWQSGLAAGSQNAKL